MCLANDTFLYLLLYHILMSTFHCPLLRTVATFLCFRSPFKMNLPCKDYQCSLLQGKGVCVLVLTSEVLKTPKMRILSLRSPEFSVISIFARVFKGCQLFVTFVLRCCFKQYFKQSYDRFSTFVCIPILQEHQYIYHKHALHHVFQAYISSEQV